MNARLPVYIFLFIAAIHLAPLRANAQASPEKPKIICDHAAPPRGMHWVCKSQCDCHLEGKLKNDEDGIAAGLAETQQGSVGRCQRSAIVLVIPQYPADANRINSKVSVRVVVDSMGNVAKADVLGGHPMLYSTVLDAVTHWKFDPACGVTHDIEFNYHVAVDDTERAGIFIRGDNVEIIAIAPSESEVPHSKPKKKKPNHQRSEFASDT